MWTRVLAVTLLVGCSASCSRTKGSSTGPDVNEISPSTTTTPPRAQAGSSSSSEATQGPETQGLRYLSDCSLTNPVAVDPCNAVVRSRYGTRGLGRCSDIGVAAGQACKESAQGCYVEKTCPDGTTAISSYLVCAATSPDRCFTKSSQRYKKDVHYLSAAEREVIARRIASIPLARFRYLDQKGGDERLGFLTEDAVGAPFVSDEGRTVDLYGLLGASIAAIQSQDERIAKLESQLRECRR